jgi:hypothetical protein
MFTVRLLSLLAGPFRRSAQLLGHPSGLGNNMSGRLAEALQHRASASWSFDGVPVRSMRFC